VTRCQCDNLIAVDEVDRMRQNDQAAARLDRQCRNHSLDISDVPHFGRNHRRPELSPRHFGCAQIGRMHRYIRVQQYHRPRNVGRILFEHFEPLSPHLRLKVREPCEVAARVRETFDKAAADRVGDLHEYARHGTGRLAQRRQRRISLDKDKIRRKRDQVPYISAHALGATLGEAIKHIVMIVRRVFERDVLLVLLSIVGLLLFLVRRAGRRVKNGSALGSTELFRDAIVLPPLIYGVFMLINFQGPPDLIPIVPFVGIFASWALVWFASVLGQKAPVAGQTRLHASELVGAVVFAVILAVVFWRAGTFKLRGLKLRDQDAAVAQLRQDLQPSDRIYVHGAVELLVLLNTPNLNPYVDFDWGKDSFVASMRGVSFQYLLDEMEVQAPKYVALTRLRKVYHRKELKRWVEERYQPVELWRKRSLYVRQ